MNCSLQVRHLFASRVVVSLGLFLILGIVPIDLGASPQQSSPPPQSAADVPPELVAPVDYSGQIPAHVSAVEGTATLERDGKVNDVEENIILLAGDRLRTSRGRIEILYTDGSSIAVDEYTTIDLLDDALMRMLGGRVKLAIARATGALEYRIDTAGGSTMIRTPGEYRVALLDRGGRSEVELTVLRGSAELVNDHGRTAVRAGTYAVANADQAPSLPYVANSAAWTAFERWADDLRSARVGGYSTRYLPTEVHYYAGAFDRHGDWTYEAPYGYVWYPRVDAGWRPYHYGKWSYHFQFGWTWVGGGPWTWPTHHYGRWGVSYGRWYWVPHHAWAPAWVSWAYSPGYVSWCPLGYYNRPVYPIHSIAFNHHNPGYGWTVLPYRQFVPGVAVPRHVLGTPLPVSTWSDFRPPRPNLREDPAPLRSVGGSRSGVAVPRSSAVPRDGANVRGATIGNSAVVGPVPSTSPPSGSRSPVGSRLSTPTDATSRAVPRDRPGTPIEAPEPVRLRSTPPSDAGGFADRTPSPGTPNRSIPGQRLRSSDPATGTSETLPPGGAIRRTQPAPGSDAPNTGWPTRQPTPTRQATPPPTRSAPPPPSRGPAPSVRTPDSGREAPSGSRPAPSGPSSGPSRPSSVSPRGGGSSSPSSVPPPRASSGSGSRQAPPSSSSSSGSSSRSSGSTSSSGGQAVRRGGSNR